MNDTVVNIMYTIMNSTSIVHDTAVNNLEVFVEHFHTRLVLKAMNFTVIRG